VETPTQKTKRNLFGKLLKIGLIALLLLLLVVIGSGVYLVYWIGSDEVKTFNNVEIFGGGSLSVGKVTVSDIWDYPELELTVHDLHVWENDRISLDSAFFVMYEGQIRLRADLFNSDTILLRQLSYDGGRVHLTRDTKGENAAERMRDRIPKRKLESRYKIVGSPDLITRLASVDIHLANPNKGKDYKLFVNSAEVQDLEMGDNHRARIHFDVQSEYIIFRTNDGAFAEDTHLRGVLDFQLANGKATMNIPDLMAGESAIGFFATVFPQGDSVSHFKFDLPEANMELLRPLLSPDLRSKIVDYDVKGIFAAKVKLDRINKFGIKPNVVIDLKLRGNQARVKQYTFEDLSLDAVFENRIPSQRGNYNPDTLGSTLTVDTVSGKGFGFDFTAVNTKVITKKNIGASIVSKAHGVAPAKALSDLLKNDQYIFTKGEVELTADLCGPLYRITELLDLSNCSIKLTNPSILLVEADVELPFKNLEIRKQGNIADVKLAGVTGKKDHSFSLKGTVEGVSRLVGGEKPDPVRTQVMVQSPHLSWQDLSAYLGTKADADEILLASTSTAGLVIDTRAESASATSTKNNSAVSDDKDYDPASLKTVLTAIQSSFQPSLDIEIDTVSYLKLDLLDFSTGMHFDGADTLVLERTTFMLDTAKIGLDGSICVGHKDNTEYEFSLKARHLNVEKVLPKVNYLGSKLLEGLNTLPNDVDVEINQLGLIHDIDGLVPNSSTGYIDLVSNKQQAFKARVDFEPDRPEDPAFNSTHVKLEGNAVLFNEFFDTEDFLFQAGEFNVSLDYSGLVPDLKTLIQKEEMTLDFRKGRVLFRSADLEVPVNSLTLNMENDTADVKLLIRSNELGQELFVNGVANNISEVVIGETGKQFSTRTDVFSKRIVWKDLNGLIGSFSNDQQPDTTVDLQLRKSIRAIMTKFRPDVALRIDELHLNERLALENLKSGLRMDDHDVLFVDTTGFSYGKGSMNVAGSIDLADLEMTPFDLVLNTDDLDLASLLVGFDYFGVQSLKETDILEGKVSLELDLAGDILGHGGGLHTESAKGKMNFRFYDLEVEGLQQIDELAARFKMVDRLEDIKIAPISNVISIDTNTVHIPLMEIPTTAFRVFLAGDMGLGGESNYWLSIPLANITTPDSAYALQPMGYSESPLKVHLEFKTDEKTGDLKTKLRWSRRRYYKERDELDKWRADKKRWREERQRARRASKN
jgi:hypothetical protein